MLNIISRSVLFGGVSGPKKVVTNLIKGLKGAGYPFAINRRLDYCSRLYIHDDVDALKQLKTLDRKIKVIVGPNLYTFPRDISPDIDLSRAIYSVPSVWSKDFWLYSGYKFTMDVWPTGIDAQQFISSPEKGEYILIYFKRRFEWELKRLISELERKHLAYRLVSYDKGYKEDEFKGLLNKSRYAVWLGCFESQGIALQEVMAANVPILVCDTPCIGHCTGETELGECERTYVNTTSAPYFDERCGLKIKELDSLGDALVFMEENLHSFKPREYILENLSLEGQARKLLGLYERHFGLAYESGLNELPMNEGNWKNAEWQYVLTLKVRYLVKIILVRLGVWRLIKRFR